MLRFPCPLGVMSFRVRCLSCVLFATLLLVAADLSAQTAVARAVLLNNHNRFVKKDLPGVGVLLRGAIGDSPIAWRLGVDHARGERELTQSTCQGLVSPGDDCVPEPTVSRSRFWSGSAGLSVAIVDRPRGALSVVGDLHLAELAVRMHGQRTDRTLRSTQPLLGVSGGLAASWKPVLAWPVALEAEMAAGHVPPYPGMEATDTFYAGGVEFRRYSLGLAWRL